MRKLANYFFSYTVVLIGMALLASRSAVAQDVPQNNNWMTIGKDIQLNRVRLFPDSLFSPEVVFVRIKLNQYRISAVRAVEFGLGNNDVRSLARASKALIGINANFFDEKGRALGLVMSHGILHSKVHEGGKTLTGIFEITRKGPKIVTRSGFKQYEVIEAIQAGPRLLESGKLIGGQRDKHVSSRRAGICIHEDRSVSFYISSGLIGVTIEQLQDLLTSREIACVDALNLDGGGSAQLYISPDLPQAMPSLQEIVVHGRDNIPVILGVFSKRQAQ